MIIIAINSFYSITFRDSDCWMRNQAEAFAETDVSNPSFIILFFTPICHSRKTCTPLAHGTFFLEHYRLLRVLNNWIQCLSVLYILHALNLLKDTLQYFISHLMPALLLNFISRKHVRTLNVCCARYCRLHSGQSGHKPVLCIVIPEAYCIAVSCTPHQSDTPFTISGRPTPWGS